MKDDASHNTQMIDVAVKILVKMTAPAEQVITTYRSDTGTPHVLSELNQSFNGWKEVFSDSRNVKIIVDHVKFLIEKNDFDTQSRNEGINDCLLFIRNILLVPGIAHNPSKIQNQIVWNFFSQGIDKILIYLICNDRTVLLIYLFYYFMHVCVII